MKWIAKCLNQETSGDSPSLHRLSSAPGTRDGIASVPDDPACLDGQATQGVTLPASVSDRALNESSDTAPDTASSCGAIWMVAHFAGSLKTATKKLSSGNTTSS